jgi:hypothetical protein
MTGDTAGNLLNAIGERNTQTVTAAGAAQAVPYRKEPQ